MSSAFSSRSDCDIEYVEAISDVSLRSDVQRPPNSLCFDLNFPPDPTPFDFGCYAPAISLNSSTNLSTPANSFNASLSWPNSSETGQCEPTFVFDVTFGCPGMAATTSAYFTGSSVAPSLNASFTRQSSSCQFDLSLDLLIPCARIAIGGSITMLSAGATPTFSATPTTAHSSTGCDFSFSLALGVPQTSVPSVSPADVDHDGAVAASGSDLECCDEFTLPDADTLKLARTSGTELFHLEFETHKFTVPNAPYTNYCAGVAVASLSGIQTIDGQTPSADDTVLLTRQTSSSDNGCWRIKLGAWVRLACAQPLVAILSGNNYSGTIWIMTTALNYVCRSPLPMKVIVVHNNYLECTDPSGQAVNVARPPLNRWDSLEGGLVTAGSTVGTRIDNSVTYTLTYTAAQARSVSGGTIPGGTPELQIIGPVQYLPNDIVRAVPANVTVQGDTTGTVACLWESTDARVWGPVPS